ncbi:MAG TPA: hypothetical protein ENN36_10585 [Candidatus Bathyarchaeota archaeon]|nr:hypothetical protein [Candidatus Bathyarchaeota archaeon]
MSTKMLLSIMLLFVLLCSVPSVSFASSGNWVEVVRYAGSLGVGDSPTFTINHIEWRIRWEYSSIFGWDWDNDFAFYVVDHVSEETVASVSGRERPDEKNGTLNIYYHTGEFHIFFPPGSTEWIIIIEQNTDSIPEFPQWIILSLLITATLLIMVCKQKLPKTPSQQPY